MSNELKCQTGVTGQTITATIVLNTTITQTGISCSEVSGGHGLYVGSMPTVSAGLYVVQFLSGSTVVGVGTINWDGTAEIIGGGSGGSADGSNVNVNGVTTAGAVALRAALVSLSIGVYSSTIKLPRGWLVTIVQGDDCLVSNSHALGNFYVPDVSLVGSTAYMAIRMPGGTDVVTAGVAVTDQTQILSFELPSATTTTMQPGEGTADVRFVDGSGNQSTWIINAAVRVYPRIGT